jgi:hypothetical protein
MPHGRTDTIVSSIATTNDDNVLALGVNVAAVVKVRVEKRRSVQLKIQLDDVVHVIIQKCFT